MFTLSPSTLLLAAASALAAWAILSSVFQNRQHLRKALDVVDVQGKRLQHWKDGKLERWFYRCHISADAVSISRPAFIFLSLYCFTHHRPYWAGLWFTLGWLTDFVDGPLARLEARRTNRVTAHGQVLDIGVDFLAFVAMIIIVGPSFPRWFTWVFAGTVAVRVVYGVALFIRHGWPLRLLPENFLGKTKTIFIAVGFGLMIVSNGDQTAVKMAQLFAVVGVGCEVCSLLHQGFHAARSFGRPQAARDNIVRFPSTGTDE